MNFNSVSTDFVLMNIGVSPQRKSNDLRGERRACLDNCAKFSKRVIVIKTEKLPLERLTEFSSPKFKHFTRLVTINQLINMKCGTF